MQRLFLSALIGCSNKGFQPIRTLKTSIILCWKLSLTVQAPDANPIKEINCTYNKNVPVLELMTSPPITTIQTRAQSYTQNNWQRLVKRLFSLSALNLSSNLNALNKPILLFLRQKSCLQDRAQGLLPTNLPI